MSFIRTTRLFSNEIRLNFFLAYFLDFLALCFLTFVIFVSVPELEKFSSVSAHIQSEPIAIGMIGALGLYGTRISMYIAIIRKNKAPQVLEWWATLIGLSFAVALFLFSGYFLQFYGSLHGYRICRIDNQKLALYDFGKTGVPCTTKS